MPPKTSLFALFALIALTALVARPGQASPPVEPAVVVAATELPGFSLPLPDGSFDAARAPRRRPVRRRPPPARAPRQVEVSPVKVGLGGAAGAAIGTTVGLAGIAAAGAFAGQVVGPQPPEVVLATSAIAIGIAVATPFMAGLGGGAGVLLADPRSRPEEWQGLLQCAASGYCAGLAAVGGALLGGGAGCAPQSCTQLPGPDRPAEWTAVASMAGLVGGGLVGVVAGYTAASDKTNATFEMGAGALGGALLGSAAFAGVVGAVTTMARP
jgi:hypothetical protein